MPTRINVLNRIIPCVRIPIPSDSHTRFGNDTIRLHKASQRGIVESCPVVVQPHLGFALTGIAIAGRRRAGRIARASPGIIPQLAVPTATAGGGDRGAAQGGRLARSRACCCPGAAPRAARRHSNTFSSWWSSQSIQGSCPHRLWWCCPPPSSPDCRPHHRCRSPGWSCRA
mgnify:CR=1 FL=1